MLRAIVSSNTKIKRSSLSFEKSHSNDDAWQAISAPKDDYVVYERRERTNDSFDEVAIPRNSFGSGPARARVEPSQPFWNDDPHSHLTDVYSYYSYRQQHGYPQMSSDLTRTSFGNTQGVPFYPSGNSNNYNPSMMHSNPSPAFEPSHYPASNVQSYDFETTKINSGPPTTEFQGMALGNDLSLYNANIKSDPYRSMDYSHIATANPTVSYERTNKGM